MTEFGVKQGVGRYDDACQQIIYRCNVIKEIRESKSTYSEIDLEKIALHVRKICENLAFLGLISNELILGSAIDKFQKTWKIGEIFSITKKFGGDILPMPIDIVEPRESDDLRIAGRFVARKVKTPLDEKYIKDIHGKVGNLLHSFNPYRNSKDLNFLPKILNFPECVEETIRLHELSNDLFSILGQMENGKLIIYYAGKSGDFDD